MNSFKVSITRGKDLFIVVMIPVQLTASAF